MDGKSSSKSNFTGVDVTCATLLFSFPLEFQLVKGDDLFGVPLLLLVCLPSTGLNVILLPFPEGGVENKLPFALLFVELLLLTDGGLQYLGGLNFFFFIFLGDMTGRSDVKWHKDSSRIWFKKYATNSNVFKFACSGTPLLSV